MVFVDNTESAPSLANQMAMVRRILDVARHTSGDDDLFLLLEDDVIFNRHLMHNLTHWRPVCLHRHGDHFFASLFNPGVGFLETDFSHHFGRAKPNTVHGSQALLLSRATAHFFATSWGVCPASHVDIKMAHLASFVSPILFHSPSLVQHVGVKSLWGGPFLFAKDFDVEWHADSPGCAS